LTFTYFSYHTYKKLHDYPCEGLHYNIVWFCWFDGDDVK
jgi:hypothetical protein